MICTIALVLTLVISELAGLAQIIYAQDGSPSDLPNKTFLPFVTGGNDQAAAVLAEQDTVSTNAVAALSAEAAAAGAPAEATSLWESDASSAALDETSALSEQAQTEIYTQYINDLYAKESVVSSFATSYGDVVDCVKIEAQPGLQRSGLRADQIQLQPTNLPVELASESTVDAAAKSPTSQELFSNMESNSCARGSVPILRLTVDKLRRFKNIDTFHHKYPSNIEPPRLGATALHQYAVARRNLTNMGAESHLNLWQPYTELNSEFSLSQIWVSRGTGSNLETVEAGWQKYRNLYGDFYPRLFIYFTPDNYGSRGCYNLTCRAFVQVNNSVIIGGRYTNYSSFGGAQYHVALSWFKDGTTGNWWLRHGTTWVGYYPRTLFDANGIRDSASQITFGGEIINSRPSGRHTHTDMGSGRWPYQGFAQAAFQKRIQYYDTRLASQRATSLSTIITDRWCYDIALNSSTDDNWRQYFYFGGSGYNTECQ